MNKKLSRGLLAASLCVALHATQALAMGVTPLSKAAFERGVNPPLELVQRADGLYRPDGVVDTLATPGYVAARATPEAMAREFVAARHAQLGLSAAEVNTLTRSHLRDNGAFSVVRFEQRFNGLPVYGSDIAVSVQPDGKITYVANASVTGLEPIDTSGGIDSAAALATAKQYLGVDELRIAQTRRMVYVADGGTHLVWRVMAVAKGGLPGDWEILVDARSGDVLRAEDKAAYATGTATVWTPDPLSFTRSAYGGGYVDGGNADTQQLTDALVPVTLENITQNGSNYELSGPYVVCANIEPPNDAACPSQPGTDFSVTRSAMTFDATMVYYHINAYLKYVNETLGVTAMPRNHAGGVRVDPHGFNGDDNSRYSGAGEDLSFGQGGVDDAQDADVIIHELGHGIHDWITGGHLSQVQGLSEGFGDYTAGAYSRDYPDQWTPADTAYNWVFNWDGHNPFWNGRVLNWQLNHSYPGNLGTPAPHTPGQYWSSCNLEARKNVQALDPVNGGRIFDKAYFQGMSSTGGSTNQQAGAQAIINAAASLGYSQAQIDAIGVAYNSGTGGGNTGCTYGVTVPTATAGPVVSVPEASLAATAEAGTSTTATLTVANTGSAALTWNIDTSDTSACTTPSSVAWLGFAPNSGSVATLASTSVTVTFDAASLTPGTYSTFACVHSNDSATPVVARPVTFTVEPDGDDIIFVDGFESAGASCDPVQLFQDPSFEATDPGSWTNPFWNSDDSIAGSSMCDVTCDDGGTVEALTGDWFVWFGGWDMPNTSWLSQTVTFPNGQARWLNYYLMDQIDGDPTASLVLSIDGTPVQTIPSGGNGSIYEPRTVEIPTQFLDGGSHTVRFDWSADSNNGEIGGAIIDDMTLDCSAQPTRPAPQGAARRGDQRRTR